ncbi:MAG: hypothetical protein IPL52_15485 [Flavobacteriales bacterium]|nr:hypothetical protein [Flavobacteriales bacterium]
MERGAFGVLCALIFGYVVLRAVHVPLTHDEAVSYFQYVLTGAFQPGYAHWDAGNHLLSTALGHLSFLAFGSAPLALRLFSVLGFLLYALYVWRFGLQIDQMLIRWALWAALLLTPFVLDFFSLFRGYGLALAFGMMGLYHLLRFANKNTTPHLLWALLGWSLAGFSSLTLLLLWIQALGLIACSAVFRRGSFFGKSARIGLTLGLGGPPLAYAIWYGNGLASRSMLYYGSDQGLFKGTLSSLSRLLLGSEAMLVLWVVVAILAASLITAAIATSSPRTPNERWSPIGVLGALLVGELAGRTFLGAFWNVPYPIDRTAAHLVPLCLLLTAMALDWASVRRPVLRYLAIPFLTLPIRTVAGVNVDRTTLWPEEALDKRLIRAVEDRQAKTTRPLLISAWNQLPEPWLYARANGHPTLPPLMVNGFPIENADLLLLDTIHSKTPSGFRTVCSTSDGVLHMLERKETLGLVLLADTLVNMPRTDAAFFRLWELPGGQASGKPVLVELDLRMTTYGQGPMISLVSDSQGADGRRILYDGIELNRVYKEWSNDSIRVARYFHPTSPPDWAVVYLWMINGRSMEGLCRVRTYIITNPPEARS